MKPRFIEIGRSTARVHITPPYKKYRAEDPLCPWERVTLTVKREGRSDILAVYPALPENDQWVFNVDDVLRNAHSGWYILTARCCGKPVYSTRARLLLPEFGATTATSADRDMCDDWNLAQCVAPVTPCVTPKPIIPCVSRAMCGSTGPLPVCGPGDSLTSQRDLNLYPPLSGPPPCATCGIPCATGTSCVTCQQV